MRSCPTSEGIVHGEFEYSITSDETLTADGDTSRTRHARRLVARLIGQVGDDALIREIELVGELTIDGGESRDQRSVPQTFRPSLTGVDWPVLESAVRSAGDLSVAPVITWAGEFYKAAQAEWWKPNACVEFSFDPPTGTRAVASNEAVQVRAELRSKQGGAAVPWQTEHINVLGGGQVSPQPAQAAEGAGATLTYTASLQPRRGHGFGLATVSRAGVGEGQWHIRPAERFEGTFSQSQHSSIGASEIAGAPLPPGAPSGLGQALAQSAARYGVGATSLSEISGRLVWVPDDSAARAKTFGEVDSTFYVPSTDDGEITFDVKSGGQSMVGACTIEGTKTFQVRELPPAARQFFVLEVAADGRYKVMLGMFSGFLDFDATQTCRVMGREIVERVVVNDAAIVLGQRQGAMTPDGEIEGETPGPIVFGVFSFTGRWSFKRVEQQQ